MYCKLGRTMGTCVQRVTSCTLPPVYEHYTDKMPSAVCIDEIKSLQEDAQSWFEYLIKDCGHHVGGLCHIPLDIHPETGPIVCKLKNCHLCD